MDSISEIRPPSLPGSSQSSPRGRPSPRKPAFKPSKPPVTLRDKSSRFSISNQFSVDGSLASASLFTTATLTSTTQGEVVINSSRIPFNAPISNRQDVQALEAWTQKELESLFVEENYGHISSVQRHISQVGVLDQSMKSLSDLIRVHCADQAALLWKLWSSASDLYGGIFSKMTQSVEELRIKLADKTLYTTILEEKVKSLRTSRNSERAAAAMLDDTNAIIRNLEEDLMLKDKELLELQSTITNIALWFPNFSKFSDSVLTRYLPPINPDDKPMQLVPPVTYHQPNATEELNKQLYFAQDYLLTDLKRLEHLGIGLEVGTPYDHLKSRVDRSASIASSFGIVSTHPHDTSALPMGIFGGPQMNTSFVAAKEFEYNLQSDAANEDDAAISRAAAAVQGASKTNRKSAQPKHSLATTLESNEHLTGGSVREFYQLQGKRATALDSQSNSFSLPASIALHHAREAVNHTSVNKDTMEIGMKNMMSSFEEQLELCRTKVRKTLDHMQQVEADMQAKTADYVAAIEKMERELKLSQKREKALKDQLNAAKSEGEHIMASLPPRFFVSMSLPPLPRLSLVAPAAEDGVDFEQTHRLMLEFMTHFVSRTSYDGNPSTYDTFNNLLNGQTGGMSSMQALHFAVQETQFSSITATFFVDYLCSKFQSSREAKVVFNKTVMSVLKKAWSIAYDFDASHVDWCNFYMKLFGMKLESNTLVDHNDDFDSNDSAWISALSSIDIREQYIFLDFSVHAFRALKKYLCDTTTTLLFPIFQTEKLLLRMFEKVGTLSTKSDNVEDNLLNEGMMLCKMWWRRIPDRHFSHLADVIKMKAVFPASPEENIASNVPVIGVFDCITCAFQHVLTMESRLKTILKDLFKFLKSVIPNGCADPSYAMLLQGLLYTNPTTKRSHDAVLDLFNHTKENPNFHNMRLMHLLKMLELNGELHEESFANTLLLFVDGDIVKSWAKLIDESTTTDYLQNSCNKKNELVNLVEKFARNDNVEVFQPSPSTATVSSPELQNELVGLGKVVTEYVSELLNRCKANGPQHSISSKSAKSALLITSTTSKFVDSVNMNQMLQSEDISQFVDTDWTDYEFLVRLVGHGKLCFLPEYGKGLSIKVARAWFTLSTFKLMLGSNFDDITALSMSLHDASDLDTIDLHWRREHDIAEIFHKTQVMKKVFGVLASNAFEPKMQITSIRCRYCL